MSAVPEQKKDNPYPAGTYEAYVRRGYKPLGNHLIRTDSKTKRVTIILMAARNLK